MHHCLLTRPTLAEGRLSLNESALQVGSVALGREVVEFDDRIGLRPEPDLARLLERVVRPFEDLVALVGHDEVVAYSVELERVPGVLGHLDVLAPELPAVPAPPVIDPH